MPLPNLPKPARLQLGGLFQEGVRSVARALPLCLGNGETTVRSGRMESMTHADLQRHLLTKSGKMFLVGFSVTGAFGGAIALWTDPTQVSTLLETMVPGVHENGFDEKAEAAYTEICNILVSSFLNVAADRLRSFCIPSVPRFAVVEPATLLAHLPGTGFDEKGIAKKSVWVTRMTLERGQKRCELHLLALPDTDFEMGLERLS